MKMNFGRRQLVLATLVFVLSGAIYLNWRFVDSGNDFTATSQVTEGENYGDSQLVNAENGEDVKKGDEAKTEDVLADEKNKEKSDDKDGKDKKDDKDNKDEKDSKATSKTDEKYFADTKLEKDKKHDESVETIQTSLSNKDLPNEEKAKLTSDLSAMVMQGDTETKIESLIKAKGFEDCVVFIDTDKANVVVKSDGLSNEQAAQIKDIVLRESKCKSENIRIVEVK